MIKDTLKDKMDRLAWKASVKADKAKQAVKEAGKWAMNHPGESIAIASGCGAALTGVNRLASKVRRTIEENRRDKAWYDPRLGGYVYTRRKLTNKEKIELSMRNTNGESVTQILDSMRLLKR